MRSTNCFRYMFRFFIILCFVVSVNTECNADQVRAGAFSWKEMMTMTNRVVPDRSKSAKIEIVSGLKNTIPGTALNIKVRATNTGSVENRFCIYFKILRRDKNIRIFPEIVRIIPAYSYEDYIFTWNVPENVGLGSYYAAAFVCDEISGTQIIGEYYRDVRIFGVIVNKNASIRILNQIGTKKRGELINLKINVKNTGDVVHNFPIGFSISNCNKDWDLSWLSKVIEPGNTVCLDFRWRVPEGFEPGNYSLRTCVYNHENNGHLHGMYDSDGQLFDIVE